MGGDETEAISDFCLRGQRRAKGFFGAFAKREQDVVSGENVELQSMKRMS